MYRLISNCCETLNLGGAKLDIFGILLYDEHPNRDLVHNVNRKTDPEMTMTIAHDKALFSPKNY